MRKLSESEKAEYDRLTAKAEQIQQDIDDLLAKPVIYGYVRVSSKGQARDGNSLEAQGKAVRDAGATEIYTDVYTGTTTDRPQLDALMGVLRPGDTLIVTKLDRIARSVQQGVALIDGLIDKGVNIHVLNMGLMDSTPTGKLIRNVLLSFAEFERDLIMQRTREGKDIARQRPGYREGRKKKYTELQIRHAMDLLDDGHSYSQVVKLTGISKSTLIRERRHNNEEI